MAYLGSADGPALCTFGGSEAPSSFAIKPHQSDSASWRSTFLRFAEGTICIWTIRLTVRYSQDAGTLLRKVHGVFESARFNLMKVEDRCQPC